MQLFLVNVFVKPGIFFKPAIFFTRSAKWVCKIPPLHSILHCQNVTMLDLFNSEAVKTTVKIVAVIVMLFVLVNVFS